ncbi:phage terminase small subunit P27 family [Bradyrhizobium sp. Ash2021]|uniref:phage terminase small subunit P27 family n=1 Tax=Bradyrhizobium sp. Ash2021 TaxID=2954771 RepID=UPI0028167801|nr:phage terminase small subunit P27 family [Bradyrhizobium sp. Ash2021]WMT76059.1 phage terminase small subunit P27 family [Bradyrhizobium sp. Ash2021]
MPGPPPEHPRLSLLKGNPGKRPARSPPQPACPEECPPPPRHLNAYAKEEWQNIAPELHRLNLLTVLDIGPLSAYCSAAAQLRQAEEAIEEMAKRDPRGHALTIKGSAGSQVTNPLLRIASQAMNDMQRIGAQFGLTPTGRLRLSGVKPPSAPSKFDGLLG